MSYNLNEEEQLVLATVRRFLDKEVAPVASEIEHATEYPTEIAEGMKRLGLFGANIPEQYGGLKSFGHPDYLGAAGLAFGLVANAVLRH